MAEILRTRGSENAAQTFKERGHGAYLAGAWSLASAGVIKDWQEAMHYAEEPAKGTKKQWMGQLELAWSADTRKADMQKVVDELSDKISYCTSTWGERKRKDEPRDVTKSQRRRANSAISSCGNASATRA